MTTPDEELFETTICAWLAEHGGYVAIKNDRAQGEARDFDPVRGLDTGELYTFLGATQVDAWNEPVKRYGRDPDVAQARFADRLAGELDKRGVVDVLRHGVVDQGVSLRLAYFRPAHGLTPDLLRKYDANASPPPASCATRPDRPELSTWRCSSTAFRWPPPS